MIYASDGTGVSLCSNSGSFYANNEAKYKVLLVGLFYALQKGPEDYASKEIPSPLLNISLKNLL